MARHGPCSPSTYERRPEAIESEEAVAAYTLCACGPDANADRNAGGAAEQRRTIEVRGVQRGITLLEHQPLLRVHRHRLGDRHTEAPVVEALGAAHEAAVPHAQRHRARRLRKRLELPSLQRHLANGVGARGRQAPRRASGIGAARQHGTRPNEHRVPPGCNRSGLQALRWRRGGEKRGQAGQQSLARQRGCGRRGKRRNVRLQLAHGGVVEDQRLGQCRLGVAAQPLRQPAAQLHRAQRVESRLHQRHVSAHVSTHHLGDHRAHRIAICRHTGRSRTRRRIQRRALEHRRQLHEQWAIRRRCRGGPWWRRERGNPLRQPAAQLHRAQRVEPRLHQRHVSAHVPADHLGDHRAHRDASVGWWQRRRAPIAGWLRGGRELRRCRCGRRALCDGVDLRDELHWAEREWRELNKLVRAPAERVHTAEAVRGKAAADGCEVGGRVAHARVEARGQRGVDGARAAHSQREHGGRRARAVREDADGRAALGRPVQLPPCASGRSAPQARATAPPAFRSVPPPLLRRAAAVRPLRRPPRRPPRRLLRRPLRRHHARRRARAQRRYARTWGSSRGGRLGGRASPPTRPHPLRRAPPDQSRGTVCISTRTITYISCVAHLARGETLVVELDRPGPIDHRPHARPAHRLVEVPRVRHVRAPPPLERQRRVSAHQHRHARRAVHEGVLSRRVGDVGAHAHGPPAVPRLAPDPISARE
eukprot:scaffold15028_cov84-Phaeocystis_antarctica.AAC.1